MVDYNVVSYNMMESTSTHSRCGGDAAGGGGEQALGLNSTTAILRLSESFDSVPAFRKNFGGSSGWGYVVVYVGSGEMSPFGVFVE